MTREELGLQAAELAGRLAAGELPPATRAGIPDATRRALAEAGLAAVDGSSADRAPLLFAIARGDAYTAWHLAEESPAGAEEAVQVRSAAVMVGAAYGALDEYEAFVRSRVTESSPASSEDPETDLRRWLGTAIGRLETARLILDEILLEQRDPETQAIVAREVTRLAYGTVQDIIVRAAGGLPDREHLDRAVAAMVALWGHAAGADDDALSRRVGRRRLQLDAA